MFPRLVRPQVAEHQSSASRTSRKQPSHLFSLSPMTDFKKHNVHTQTERQIASPDGREPQLNIFLLFPFPFSHSWLPCPPPDSVPSSQDPKVLTVSYLDQSHCLALGIHQQETVVNPAHASPFEGFSSTQNI